MSSTGALLASIISFMGLLALSVLKVNRRTKEIGMRKVLGDSESGILNMLLKETLVLLLLSMIIAFIASYISMNYWLSGFSDRISLHWSHFVISGISAAIIMMIAVGWQSWRAAIKNPVESLRYE
ncbi:ABC transporter permease [Alkalitalea saponilacus]|uniref:FtsX-like permease family protein n=1 Tax=Alkalitalea saponilacus TaxID=889453 RepID=A0A1T5CXC3_9BACT|nr:ABC transporter permease [Alkalitalea saponilacus]ASB50520.1 hypothetical protein CDL62_15880 [Alkalitalea saponilacus]SKB64168.1 FtsX-like permease family protein [Alkalitalea saponilacus]